VLERRVGYPLIALLHRAMGFLPVLKILLSQQLGWIESRSFDVESDFRATGATAERRRFSAVGDTLGGPSRTTPELRAHQSSRSLSSAKLLSPHRTPLLKGVEVPGGLRASGRIAHLRENRVKVRSVWQSTRATGSPHWSSVRGDARQAAEITLSSTISLPLYGRELDAGCHP